MLVLSVGCTVPREDASPSVDAGQDTALPSMDLSVADVANIRDFGGQDVDERAVDALALDAGPTDLGVRFDLSSADATVERPDSTIADAASALDLSIDAAVDAAPPDALQPDATIDAAPPDALRPDATIDAAVDAAPPDAVVEPEDICFIDIDLERWCYSQCDAAGRCANPETMCQLTQGGAVCVPDCRAVGCLAGLVCEANTGHCKTPLDSPVFSGGRPCEAQADCPDSVICGAWRQINDEWVLREIEAIRALEPDATATCFVTCEACVAIPNNFACTPDQCTNFCEAPRPWPPESVQCVPDMDLCWADDCPCIDSQLGHCMVPE